MINSFDLVVIGSGPGGYVAAIRAAQLGLKTAIIEKYENLGGTCLNVGCIPSKSLLDSSEHYYYAKYKFKEHGIQISNIEANFAHMISRKNEIIKNITKGIKFLMNKNKISVFYGIASFINSKKINVSYKNEIQTITSNFFIIATGSKSKTTSLIKINKKRIITSTQALNLKEIPKHLVIIGGGVIGLEFGSIYLRLGSKITLIEHSNRIIPSMDKTLSLELQKILTKQGINFIFSNQVEEIIESNNQISVKISDKNNNNSYIKGDYLLIAIGRTPNTNNLKLENIGIDLDQKGSIKVNDSFQTNVSNIYAIGDVIPGLMLAHKATEEGIIVSEIISGQKPMNSKIIPIVIYTSPEVASVGKTEEDLQKMEKKYKTGTFNMKNLGRAKASSNTDGIVKILSDKKTDEILGVHIIGSRAADIISECVVAMEYRASAEDIARIIHPHPTFSESIKEAALDATEGRSIHK